MDLYPQALAVSDQITLRPLQAGDAAAITDGLSDWAVTQWLTVVPYPYGQSDAVAFLSTDRSSGAMAILVDRKFAGVVQIGRNHELGYWLSRAFHGQGIMTMVTKAMINVHFSKSAAALISGYHVGNRASCNVLAKLGFRVTGHSLKQTARGDTVVLRHMILTRGPDAGFQPIALSHAGSSDG
jgi:RimJ/RimL family protein N-acetyltransferase